MSTVRMRPTFRIPLDVHRDIAVQRLRDGFAADERFAGRWRGKGRWAELYVDHTERKLWSPHLSVRVDEEPGGCMLFGRFAPHPEVWTFFMFLYCGLAFGVVFGGVLGYVQWVSNEAPWGLWVMGVGLVAIGLIHLASWTGQRLGYDQMVSLKEELDTLLVSTGSTSVEPSGPSIP